MSTPTLPAEARSFGAFRGWPDEYTGQAWAAVMETSTPTALAAALAQAHRAGLVRDDGDGHNCLDPAECHGVLDARDHKGDLIAGWCIPSRQAFDQLAEFLGLRCTSWDVLDEGGWDRPDLLDQVTPADVDAVSAASGEVRS